LVDALNNPDNSVNVKDEDGENLLFITNQTITNYAKHETAKTLAMKTILYFNYI
jgi:hypothetical protein